MNHRAVGTGPADPAAAGDLTNTNFYVHIISNFVNVN